MLRIKNYLPRVPPGCFVVYSMPDLLDIFFTDDFIGFCTLGFPAEPWFAGFLPAAFFAVAFFIFHLPLRLVLGVGEKPVD